MVHEMKSFNITIQHSSFQILEGSMIIYHKFTTLVLCISGN